MYSGVRPASDNGVSGRQAAPQLGPCFLAARLAMADSTCCRLSEISCQPRFRDSSMRKFTRPLKSESIEASGTAPKSSLSVMSLFPSHRSWRPKLLSPLAVPTVLGRVVTRVEIPSPVSNVRGASGAHDATDSVFAPELRFAISISCKLVMLPLTCFPIRTNRVLWLCMRRPDSLLIIARLNLKTWDF